MLVQRTGLTPTHMRAQMAHIQRHKVPHQAGARPMVIVMIIRNTMVFGYNVPHACAAKLHVQPFHAESMSKWFRYTHVYMEAC
jgi:hypothetical protein